jgi:hypothetical protein
MFLPNIIQRLHPVIRSLSHTFSKSRSTNLCHLQKNGASANARNGDDVLTSYGVWKTITHTAVPRNSRAMLIQWDRCLQQSIRTNYSGDVSFVSDSRCVKIGTIDTYGRTLAKGTSREGFYPTPITKIILVTSAELSWEMLLQSLRKC